jgi:hypothetical protein
MRIDDLTLCHSHGLSILYGKKEFYYGGSVAATDKKKDNQQGRETKTQANTKGMRVRANMTRAMMTKGEGNKGKGRRGDNWMATAGRALIKEPRITR